MPERHRLIRRMAGVGLVLAGVAPFLIARVPVGGSVHEPGFDSSDGPSMSMSRLVGELRRPVRLELGLWGGSGSGDALVEALQSRDAKLRELVAGAMAFGSRGGEEYARRTAVSAGLLRRQLIEMLRHCDSETVALCARTLPLHELSDAELGNLASAVRKRVASPDPQVLLSISRLGGE